MHVCKYLNQRVVRISEHSGKYFKVFSKKNTHEEIEFHSSIQN